MKTYIQTIIALILPFMSFAQEKGLDQRIDEAFKPFSSPNGPCRSPIKGFDKPWWSISPMPKNTCRASDDIDQIVFKIGFNKCKI